MGLVNPHPCELKVRFNLKGRSLFPLASLSVTSFNAGVGAQCHEDNPVHEVARQVGQDCAAANEISRFWKQWFGPKELE